MILILAIFLSSVIVFAQKQLQVDENGNFRVKSENVANYEDTKLMISDCASDYLKYIPASMEEGDTIAVTKVTNCFCGMVSPFKCKEKLVVEKGITVKNDIIECIGPYALKDQEKPAIFVFLMLLATAFMIASNFCFNKKNKIVIAIFNIASALLAIYSYLLFVDFSYITVDLPIFFIIFSSLVVAFVNILAVAFFLSSNLKGYRIVSIIFYLLVVLFFLFLFL